MLGSALPPAGSPSHAYLFHGRNAGDQRAAARAFAGALLADGSDDPAQVVQRVARGAHPDLTWVLPSGAHELLTGDVDGPVIAAASLTPFEAARRVFVIERVETMNDEAANRMLKTLEEPPDYAHLILLSQRIADVLPTIASRCQLVRFDPLAPGEIARQLTTEGVDPNSADACARLALGDLDLARTLSGPSGRQLRESAERWVASTLRGIDAPVWRPLLAAARAAGEAALATLGESHAQDVEITARRDRRRLETEFTERSKRTKRRAETTTLADGLELIASWYRDLACVGWGADELIRNVDRRAELNGEAEGRDPATFIGAMELVDETRQRLALNVTEELALEALAYRLERLLAS